MAIGTLGLAFLAGCLSVLSPCVLPLLPIVLGTAASEHRLGPARAGRRSRHFLHRHRPVRRDRGLRHGPRHRCLPHHLRRPADRRGRSAVGAAAARAICRGGGAGQPMGGRLSRQLCRHGPRRPVRPRTFARRGVEPVRRADARRRFAARRQGRKSRPSGDHHARVRYRRRLAADAARLSVARSDAALEGANDGSGPRWQDAARRAVAGDRRVDRHPVSTSGWKPPWSTPRPTG